jgi:hypothetical protein
VLAQSVIGRFVDGQVIVGEQVGVGESGALAVGEVVGFLRTLERADQRLVNAGLGGDNALTGSLSYLRDAPFTGRHGAL